MENQEEDFVNEEEIIKTVKAKRIPSEAQLKHLEKCTIVYILVTIKDGVATVFQKAGVIIVSNCSWNGSSSCLQIEYKCVHCICLQSPVK